MKIKSRFYHYNINVTNLEHSLDFYDKALGLKEHKRKEAADGSYIIVFLSDEATGFYLELTWLRDHPQAYNLGEEEFHLAMRCEGDYEQVRAFHKENGWVCYENEAMNLYFIKDPDGYWIEVLPIKR
jgi:lactoylglutathione lyase